MHQAGLPRVPHLILRAVDDDGEVGRQNGQVGYLLCSEVEQTARVVASALEH